MSQEKVTIVIFGGTGDLTKRKLAPALANLVHQRVIEKASTIIGIARGAFTDESYKKLLIESAKNENDKNHISELNIKFFRGDATNPSTLKGLKEFIVSAEHQEENNRLFYLATSYKLFPSIAVELKKQGLHEKKGKFTRVAFEKPFGNNYRSSAEIDIAIKKVFLEEQIFRIDHYLAKETVQNIAALKYANPFFETLLNNKLISTVELTVDEELGVEERIAFYNDIGAIRDMIQSHLLQVLSLILMDSPIKLTAENIHDEKVKVLRNIEVSKKSPHLLGQYSSYQQEAEKIGIKNSKTETFAKILLECKSERWKGVNIILRTGKKLKKKYGQIIINGAEFSQEILESFVDAKPNKIVIDIYPKQDIKMIMNVRVPSSEQKIKAIGFEFCHESNFGPNTADEYATLLAEIFKGDKTLFTRFDELQESWKIIEQIDLLKQKIPLIIYPDGSDPEDIKKV